MNHSSNKSYYYLGTYQCMLTKIYSVSSYSFRGNYSRVETIQGRKLLIFRRFLPRKLFKGGKYSRAETIRGNTVGKVCFLSDGNFWVAKIQTKTLQIFNYLPTNIYDKWFIIISYLDFGHWLMQWNRHFLVFTQKSIFLLSVTWLERWDNEWNYLLSQN